jgi:hypothetical protein
MTLSPLIALLWRPYFPVIPTLAGVGVLLGLVVFVSVRTFGYRPGLSVATALMRGVLVLMLGLILMGPGGRDRPTAAVGKPVLRVLVDTSASMQVGDADGLTRFDFIGERWLTDDRLYALRGEYDVELIGFDETARVIGDEVLRRPAGESAMGGESDIAQAVTDAVIAGGGGSVLVLSDGRDTMGRPMHAVGQLARERSVPIYTVALGGPSLSRDVAVVAEPSQPYLFADEPGLIRVRVMQSNAGESRTVLHVGQGGRDEVFPIVFEGRGTVAVDVPVLHEAEGTYEYRVWAEPIAGEVETANNEQPVFVDVTAKRLRVLILEGRPYWDTKFLANALRRDSRIELTQVTQVTGQRRETIVTGEAGGGGEAGVPMSLEELAVFDVIILGRGIGDVLDGRAVGLLPRYVSEHGGRLVFARGRAYDVGSVEGRGLGEVLSVLEPVVFGRGVLRNQRVVLEAEGPGGLGFGLGAGVAGDGGDDLEDMMPTLLSLPVVVREKATARVLARAYPAGTERRDGVGQVAIVTMPYGRGMVAAVLGDGLWTWGLSPRSRGRGGRGDGSFERFWMDMVRWLAMGSDYQPGKAVTVRLSRRGVAVGEVMGVEVVSRTGFGGLDVRVEVEGPRGERIELALEAVAGSTTRLGAVLNPTEAGVYRVLVRGGKSGDDRGEESGDVIEARFNCYDIDIERLHTSANRGALRTLSELSGGRCLGPDDPDALMRLLRREREAGKSPAEFYYLWDRGWVMAALLFWAGLEWLVRRAGGML